MSAGDPALLEHDARPDPAGVLVALADTLPHALTALLTDPGEPAPDATVITAYLAQAAAEASGPDGASQLDSALHATQFASTATTPQTTTIRLPPGSTPPQTAGAPASAGGLTQAQRSRPRTFRQAEPVLVMQGAGRSFKHGGDGRYTVDGTLICRLGGATITSLGPAADDRGPDGGDIAPAGVLDGGLTRNGVPGSCQALLVELAALDPGRVQAAAAARTRAATWAPGFQPAADLQPLLPSPVAVTLPTRPWTMLRAEWQARYVPSSLGLRDWQLGDTDLEPAGSLPPPDGQTGQVVSGRLHITPGPAAVLAAVAAGLAANPDLGATSAALPDAATLAAADLVNGALDGLTPRVRGEPEGQLVGADATRPQPPDPNPLRAGQLQLTRLRLVDTYGQVINLLGSSDTSPADPARLIIPPAAAGHGPRHTAAAPQAHGGHPGPVPLRRRGRQPHRDGRTRGGRRSHQPGLRLPAARLRGRIGGSVHRGGRRLGAAAPGPGRGHRPGGRPGKSRTPRDSRCRHRQPVPATGRDHPRRPRRRPGGPAAAGSPARL